MSSQTIARRYSVALADVVSETSAGETVKAEMAIWGEMFASNNDLRTVFDNPAITHGNKEKVLDGLIEKTKPSRTTANFLKTLLQNGRLGEIGEINDRFVSVLEQRSGAVSAQVTSARKLPAPERANFEKNLEKVTGKRVIVEYVIDEDIIGGVIARIGSTVYDGSVRTKLQNLREQLVNG